MNGQFEITSFFKSVLDSSRDGRVQITGENVSWCLDIRNGQVLFAAHSLQYLMALEAILPRLGYESALSIYWRLIRSETYKWKHDAPSLEALGWTSDIVRGLIRYEALGVEQAKHTLTKLTEDAIESLLGLDTADVVWHPLPTDTWYASFHGAPIESIMQFLSERQQAWQPVCDRIISPHQRPYCDTPDDLYQSVPQGRLSAQMLKALERLMQGASIRQLAHTINQDEATLAELLYPYICDRAIKLWPPVSPLDRLPALPTPHQLAHATAAATATVVMPQGRHVGEHSTHGNVLVAPPPVEPIAAQHPYSPENNPQAHSGNAHSGNEYSSGNNHSSGNTVVAEKSPSEPENSPGSRRHLIVCIDDSQAMLEQIDSYLDPNQFELKTIIDPVASVAKICAMSPDLVLMDVSMPSINGNSLCQILKRSYVFKDVPIIMISSNASPLNKATAESSGATDYLEKPFSKAQLMKVMETYLEIQVS
ncbi:response regulator [Leptothoe kymatousa]|uniref:Response regulator n=1 Tax=Leptothoe kymatousa TAU-MAC 1615 TaxID=2364775 RepID=A0ABS5Y2J1_9CYAN|nr:response regulator [Leptothoe kymatousa]MBT9312030.1 response regulator [Leptothoe kymatousa TAU-MAC 1615]